MVGATICSLLISLVLSLNRGSWICLLFALVAAAVFYRRKINLSATVTICLLVLLAASPLIYQRFMELTVVTEYGSKNTLIGRIEGWKALWPIFLKHPIIGNGIGAVQETLRREIGITYVPHNDYIRLAVEGGVITLASYLLFLLGNLFQNLLSKTQYLNWQINYPLLAAIIYFITLSFFQNIIYNVVVFPMFTGLLAIGHKADRLARESRRQAGQYAVV